jgi:3-oxo-5alpha-steroid 4-dehydrogenase
MIVNARGERFIDDTVYGAAIGLKLCAENGGRAWLVLDGALRQFVWRQLLRGKMLSFQRYPAMLAMLMGSRKAATLAGLAAACGMDATTLQQTAAEYTSAAAGGAADRFAKAPADMAPMLNGPFLAIDMSIDATLAPLPTLTLGGLRVDEDSGAVLRPDGSAVAGLYAAGRTAIGVCSNIYVSGLSSADCAFSGRRAGLAVARVE